MGLPPHSPTGVNPRPPLFLFNKIGSRDESLAGAGRARKSHGQIGLCNFWIPAQSRDDEEERAAFSKSRNRLAAGTNGMRH